MLLRQVTGPTTFPLTRDEAKAAARIDTSAEDDLVDALIAAASRQVGEMAGRVLTEETWALSFPTGVVCNVDLPKSPVRSVSSITYYDADDVEQTANVADFYLIKDDDRAYLRPKSGEAWPVASTLREDAITVEFVSGYEVCPASLKQAVRLLVTHYYDNRDATNPDAPAELPFGVKEMVALERIGWVAS